MAALSILIASCSSGSIAWLANGGRAKRLSNRETVILWHRYETVIVATVLSGLFEVVAINLVAFVCRLAHRWGCFNR